MKLTKKIMLGLAAIGVASAVNAADLTLTIGHVDPQDWTTSKKGAATEVFKNLVEAQTGGHIKVNIYPSGQLGNETDLVQSTQDGTLSMTMVSGAFAKVCKAASVLEIPYLFPSAPVAWQVLDGSFGKALAKHCLEKTGLRTLAYGETGFRNFTNSKRPVAQPSDLKGLKIRVMTLPLYVEMVKALGAEPTPIAWPEVPAALTTGVVDGEENPVSVIDANKLYESQKYLTLDHHVYSTDFLLINEKVYESLSQKDKEIVNNAAIVAGTVGRAIQEFNSAKGLKSLAAHGMKITTPNAQQLAEFRKAAQPAVIKWLKGQVNPQWITRVQVAVKKAIANQQ